MQLSRSLSVSLVRYKSKCADKLLSTTLKMKKPSPFPPQNEQRFIYVANECDWIALQLYQMFGKLQKPVSKYFTVTECCLDFLRIFCFFLHWNWASKVFDILNLLLCCLDVSQSIHFPHFDYYFCVRQKPFFDRKSAAVNILAVRV